MAKVKREHVSKCVRVCAVYCTVTQPKVDRLVHSKGKAVAAPSSTGKTAVVHPKAKLELLLV